MCGIYGLTSSSNEAESPIDASVFEQIDRLLKIHPDTSRSTSGEEIALLIENRYNGSPAIIARLLIMKDGAFNGMAVREGYDSVGGPASMRKDLKLDILLSKYLLKNSIPGNGITEETDIISHFSDFIRNFVGE